MKSASPDLDARALEADLAEALEGEVRFDAGSRALFAEDASNYRQVPIGVVVPRSIDDVVSAVRVCREHAVPVLSRGGGTSLAGQCCNVAVVIEWTKHCNRIVELDPDRRRARVQPGLVLDTLRDEAERHHLTFGPDPATHDHCTLGGMIGNNSCGVHSLTAGKTEENIDELEILTYDGLRMRVGATSDEELTAIIGAGGRRGEIYARLRSIGERSAELIRQRYPQIPRRVSGYNLNQLLPENGFNVARALVGTEGTCVTVLEAVGRLVDSPPKRSLVVLGYDDVFAAADHVPDVLAADPIALEGIDQRLVEDMKRKHLHAEDADLLPPGRGWLLVEFGGVTKEEADARATKLMRKLRKGGPSMKLYDDPVQEKKVWKIRESGLGATARVPGQPDTWEGWEDSAVPPGSLGAYLREFRALTDRYGYQGALYGHFGQGCLHTRITFDLVSAEGVSTFRSFIEDASDLVLKFGGSFSGEHGDGQSRAELLPKMFGDELVRAFAEFKAVWDPDNKMNPGKVVEPYRIDENLRLGPEFRPAQPATHFRFPDDEGSLARATLRCVGVGACRRESGGVMCPSYMVTREEMHSTRGRAHLLLEMLEGDVITDGWRNEHVKEALDLCLACKGCRTECPVNVDMATYKAEFFSHYYERRLRPPSAYAMGLIHRWARLASRVPGLANFVTHAPGLSTVLKRAGGIAPAREAPAFATRTFVEWFRTRGERNLGKPKVLLWPDTFNNYFTPERAAATVEVLEAAGYRVVIPSATLCCGRPLYDFGMLRTAKRLLRQVVEELRDEIADGVPLVGIEPSCVAVFRDELRNLFPEDEDAKRLAKQSYFLSEFLVQEADYQPPQLPRKALVHGHCHHRTILNFSDEETLVRRMGLDLEVLDSGCCGMAGSFGFEADKYDVSMACAERELFPAVRRAPADALVITDGFSCHEQLVQGIGRRPMHIAEVLQLALRERGGVALGDYPSPDAFHEPGFRGTERMIVAGVAGVAVVAAAGVMGWLRRRRLR